MAENEQPLPSDPGAPDGCCLTNVYARRDGEGVGSHDVPHRRSLEEGLASDGIIGLSFGGQHVS
ncbi:MAG: hypothetical protein M3O94_03050, partial [Actinomycetota bacterium]|nr:hypothetical protein [Actinomycetota bacterium]